MILVAASAIGLECYRRIGVIISGSIGGAGASKFQMQLPRIEYTVAAFLIPQTLAGLWLRCLHPRPRLRHLAFRPGFAALAAASLMLAILGGQSLQRGLRFQSDLSNVLHQLAWGSINHGGTAVASAWLIVALGGRCRRGSSWIDRLGIAIGLSWVALTSLLLFGDLLP